jgi:hypothetical protein
MLVEIRNSNLYNSNGLFAVRDIKKGETILDWSKGGREIISTSHYSGNMNIDTKDAVQVDINRWILHPVARYINHSCNPNTCIGENSMSYVAIRDIKKGEECVYDYSMSENSDWKSDFTCICGNENCRKEIVSFGKLPKNLQNYYISNKYCSKYILMGVRER